jgi:hypothetical protein
VGSRVPRTVWLALICLISLGVIFTLRSNIGARAMRDETASVLTPLPFPPIDDRPPLAKSDRLPSPYFDKTAAKRADTILPAVPEAPSNPKQADDLVPQSKSEASEVTTWHWHAGSRIMKRTTVVEPR